MLRVYIRRGVIVDTVTSGEECLDIVKKNIYNIIFLDHMMPGMDGVETVSRLRNMDNTINNKSIDITRLENMLLKYLPNELIVENDRER